MTVSEGSSTAQMNFLIPTKRISHKLHTLTVSASEVVVSFSFKKYIIKVNFQLLYTFRSNELRHNIGSRAVSQSGWLL